MDWSLCKKQCLLNRVSTNYLSASQNVFYESLTRISLGKTKSSANQSCLPFRVSVNLEVNCIIIHANCSRNLKPLKKWLTASVDSRTKSYITSLLQKFYFNPFLQKDVAHRYLNIRRFDKVVKDYCNEFSKSIFFGARVEEFLFK